MLVNGLRFVSAVASSSTTIKIVHPREEIARDKVCGQIMNESLISIRTALQATTVKLCKPPT